MALFLAFTPFDDGREAGAVRIFVFVSQRSSDKELVHLERTVILEQIFTPLVTVGDWYIRVKECRKSIFPSWQWQ